MGHREDLLAAARRLLTENGYAHITARDLVAASGTNLASIGYHFGSKADLLTAAIAESFSEWAEHLLRTAFTAPAASPLQRAQAAWGEALRGLPEHRPLIVAFAEAIAQAERTPELRARFAAHYQTMRAHIAAHIAATVATDTGAAPDPRMTTLASFMMAVCDGFAIQWLLDPANTPTAAQLQDALLLLTAP